MDEEDEDLLLDNNDDRLSSDSATNNNSNNSGGAYSGTNGGCDPNGNTGEDKYIYREILEIFF